MKKIHIFNPVAGGGRSAELLKKVITNNEEMYVTTGVNDAENFIYKMCKEPEEIHFVIYGGDGTVNEAVNGIIRADAGQRCLLSVVPVGTGNDFVRTFKEKGNIVEIDAIKYRAFSDNDFKGYFRERYAINIINFGFDSRVVKKTNTYKKFFSGSAAYMAGVVDTLVKNLSESWTVELEDQFGIKESVSDKFTLALIANCKYYGGGFHSAPLANPADGLLDVLIAKKVSRISFLGLVGDYKKGTHLDPVSETPLKKFQKILVYKKCRKIRISGITDICADGELEKASSIEVEAVPKAVRIVT